jgi:hypothetical protein
LFMKSVRVLSALGLLAVAWVAAPAAAQEAAKPTVVSHDLAGREQCMMCHSGAMQGMPAAPESHAERPNETCLLCHAADAPIQTAAPAAVPHDLAGRDNCMMCHSGAMEGVPAASESHEGIDVKYCGLCHKPASG